MLLPLLFYYFIIFHKNENLAPVISAAIPITSKRLIFDPLKSAFLRFAFVKSDPLKFAFVRFAFVKSAFLRIAFVKSDPLKSAFLRIAFVKF